MTEGLINDYQGGFRTGRGCVDEISTLKKIGGRNDVENGVVEKKGGCLERGVRS